MSISTALHARLQSWASDQGIGRTLDTLSDIELKQASSDLSVTVNELQTLRAQLRADAEDAVATAGERSAQLREAVGDARGGAPSVQLERSPVMGPHAFKKDNVEQATVTEEGELLKVRATVLGSQEVFPGEITVKPEAIEIRDRALLTVQKELIFLPDIEAVQVEEGILFASVKITTQAGEHVVEGLSKADAEAVVQRIHKNTAALMRDGVEPVRTWDG